MKTKHLHPKRALRSVLFVLLLCAVGMTKSFAEDFDFSAVCSTGQTLYYKITNSTTHEVQLTYPNYHYSHIEYYDFYGFTFNNYTYWYNYSQPTGDIIIPNSVVYNGISYSVTSIGDNAFGDHRNSYSSGVTSYSYDVCSDITSIAIPSSVTTIGKDAFARCSGLTIVTVSNSISSIGDYAFYNCSSLTEVMMYSTTPSTLGSSVFDGSTCPIVVPYESLNEYKTATNWSDYEDRIFPMAYKTIPAHG